MAGSPAFGATAHHSTTHPAHHAATHSAASHTTSAHHAPAHSAAPHKSTTRSVSGHAGAGSKPAGQVAHTAQGTRSAHGAHKKATPKLRGQQVIKSERVTEIQQALIREHYLTGEPSGQWDATTKAAMQKYQATQGWQTKLMPDSRALKKLGLGPDYSNAINAKNSSFAPPPVAGTTSPGQVQGFADAAGVKQ